jgi:hypothetical protein
VPSRDLACVPEPALAAPEPPMNRFAAPLGFTLAAVWVVVLFVLVSGTS